MKSNTNFYCSIHTHFEIENSQFHGQFYYTKMLHIVTFGSNVNLLVWCGGVSFFDVSVCLVRVSFFDVRMTVYYCT